MKKAIALIELIFAIVIIGITLLAVPNLLSNTTKASNSAITQEAISNGASHLDMIMSQYWDEKCINPNNPILYVVNGDNELIEAKDSLGNNLGIRVGSNKDTPRRFSITKQFATTVSNFGLDINDTQPDDIDDFANTTYTLVNQQTTNVAAGEYKDININIATTINYISDNTIYSNNIVIFNNPFNTISTKSTNIKAIKVTITSSNDNKNIILNGFSCNIGAQKLNRRDF